MAGYPYAPRGFPGFGAAPGLPSPGNVVAPGEVRYFGFPPDASWLPANGAGVSAADYPELAAAMDMPPLTNRQLALPATLPTGNSYSSMKGPAAISDNGEWFVMAANDGSSAAVLVYRVINDVPTYITTLNSILNTLTLNAFAVSNNGDVAVGASSNLYFYKKADGANNWSLTTSPTNPSNPFSPVFSKDSQYLLVGWNASPFLGLFKVAGTSLVAQNLAAAGLSAGSTAQYINRSLNGERWAVYFNGNATTYLYDFADGVFTPIAGTPTIAFGVGYAPSISADLSYLLLGGGTQVDLYYEATRGAGYEKVFSQPNHAQQINSLYWAGFMCGDAYVYTGTYREQDDMLYAIAGRSLVKVHGPALLYPGAKTHFGITIPRDGWTILYTYNTTNGAPSIARPGTPPTIIPVPAAIPTGYGANRTYPYLKVKS